MFKKYKIKLKQYFKSKYSLDDVIMLSKVYIFFKKIFWPFVNFIRFQNLRYKKELKLHLGCGEKELPNFVNIDSRVTVAVDITRNLNKFKYKKNKIDCIFSNAFFEHLYRYSRVSHLKKVHESLKENGFVCYIGLPYFKNIAKFYLGSSPGTYGENFDLYNVYRYTHGDPELALKDGWYLGQLHKSLFDEIEIRNILMDSGFKSFVIFTYIFPFDKNPLPVSCGFYASKNYQEYEDLKNATKIFLTPLSRDYIVMNSIEFIN